jgi:stringent starvation protein B
MTEAENPVPSTKPYLVRALYEWCADNGFTPFVAVVVDAHTVVPREHVRDGQIVLNLGADATGKVVIANDGITAVARFGGVARELYLPMARIAAIYARENGAGMGFDVEDVSPGVAQEEALDAPDSAGDVQLVPALNAAENAVPSDPPPSPSGGRPRLKRVK